MTSTCQQYDPALTTLYFPMRWGAGGRGAVGTIRTLVQGAARFLQHELRVREYKAPGRSNELIICLSA